MLLAHCCWLTALDYYPYLLVDGNLHHLVYLKVLFITSLAKEVMN